MHVCCAGFGVQVPAGDVLRIPLPRAVISVTIPSITTPDVPVVAAPHVPDSEELFRSGINVTDAHLGLATVDVDMRREYGGLYDAAASTTTETAASSSVPDLFSLMSPIHSEATPSTGPPSSGLEIEF